MNSNIPTRLELADLISKRIRETKPEKTLQYEKSSKDIGYFFIDDLLPEDVALKIAREFPDTDRMTLKKSLRENKYVAAQMNLYHPLLEEMIYAFQQDQVVDEIKEICKIADLHPDKNLYAGGISSMGNDQFLNPHLDNSHDKDRDKWRVLNLLYYCTPQWKDENGGHLELWPQGVENEQVTLHSRFNRLIVMATHKYSWHSVSPVTKDGSRNCISNYYFSNESLLPEEKFHVTSFRGRPDQKLRDKVLQLDTFLRMKIRKVFKKGIVENPHVYKNNDR